MTFILKYWKLGFVLGLLAAIGAQTFRLHLAQRELQSYQVSVRAEVLAQQIETLRQTAQDQNERDLANAENSKLHDELATLTKRLQLARAGKPNVPSSPTASKCPTGQACFDRAELDRALGDFRTGIRQLASEGSSIDIDLNTARQWATQTEKSHPPLDRQN